MKKRKIIDFCILVVAVMLFSFSTVFATDDLKTETSDSTYWKVVKYDDVKQYRNNPEVVEGYLFAGWFSDESCSKDTALKTSDTEGIAYAKYVPKDILGLKAQVNSELFDEDTTNDENGAIRFVTSVDSLDYAKVGFIIDIGNGEKVKASNKVYETLFVKVGEENASGQKTTEFKANEIFHKSSLYFKTWTVTGMKNINYRTEFKVTPFWVTLDGTTVRATQSIKTVNQGRTWEYVFVDDSGDDSTGVGTREYPYQSLEAALNDMDTNLTAQIDAGIRGVDRSSSVYVLNTLTEETRNWQAHDLNLVVTTDPESNSIASLDFSKIDRVHMQDSTTFDNLNLKLYTAGNGTFYAFGNMLEITEKCNVEDGSHISVYGGGYNANVESTDIRLYTGTWRSIYGGSWRADVSGDTNVYLAGNVNDSINYTDHDNGTNMIYGGGNSNGDGTADSPYAGTVYGDTHVTITGNAKAHYVRGGGYKTDVKGTCYVNIEGSPSIYGVNGGGAFGATNNTHVVVKGGTIYQVFGGNTASGGTVNNTNVQILGGTILRRLYGGSYNEMGLFSWDDTNYHVDGYSSLTIGNEATLLLNNNLDNSLCAVSRNGSNVAPEIGVLVLNSEKTDITPGFNGLSGAGLYAHFRVNVQNSGTVTSEKDVLRVIPDNGSGYATIKAANGDVLFQCQGEGTYSLSTLTASSSMQTLTVEFSDNEVLSGNYVLSYGNNSHSYFNTLSDAIVAVSTPKASTDGVITQKTATITIGEETCTVDSTVVLDDSDNVVLQNKEGVTVTIKRGAGLTDNFVFDVVEGSALTIGGTITVDGNGVTGPSMIDNKGEFTLGENATLQNANGSGNGAALYNRKGNANLYGNMIGNTAPQGGAIANTGALIIHGGTYTGNVASNGAGGVIYSATTGNEVTIYGGSFYGNESQSATAGVVYCNGTLTIHGGEYYNNKAVSAGGVVNVAGTATITNATMHDNSLTNSSNAGGAIFVTGSRTLTLENCNIYDNNLDYRSNTNPGADVSLNSNAILNVYDNTNIGVVNKRAANVTININETYTGKLVLVPYNNVYTIGLQLVTFAGGTEESANSIVVRKYISQTEYNDDAYCVDTAGTLQHKNPEAKIGETIYPIFAEAIAAANNGETISVLKDIEVSDTIAISGDKALTIANVSGKDVKLTRTSNAAMFTVASGSTLILGSEETVNKLIIDGGHVADAENPLKAVPLVSNAGAFTLESNATIQNAVTGGSANNDNYRGGAINNKANATIKGTIRDCSAFNGGAIYNDTNGEVVITASAYFVDNTADGGNGGAIRNLGTLTIIGATFVGNKGQGSNGNGGAIFNTGTLTTQDVVFEGNTGRSGGAVYNQEGGTLIISGGKFVENSASIGSGTGGAIYVRSNTTGSVSITGTEFTKNSSIQNNSAAIDAQKDITLINCNIHDNGSSASSRNAVYDIRIGNAVLNLDGTTKTGVVYQSDVNGRIHILGSFAGNIILVPNTYTEGTPVVTFASDVADKEGIASKMIVRRVLSQDSFDDTTYYVDLEGMLQELKGVAKIGNTHYDSLAEAISAAVDGDTIYVLTDIEVSDTIAIGDNKALTITNVSGRDIKLTRTGNAAMFKVASGSTLTIGSEDTANKLIVDGGYVADAQTPLIGASLVSNAGTFTLEANAVIQNANGGSTSSVVGGALNNAANAVATIKGSIQGCSAYNGGAIYNAANGEVIIAESAVLSGNTAAGGNGGAIRNVGTLSITGATFTGNKGEGNTNYLNGGAIYNTGTLVAQDTTFDGNTGRSGGAIYNESANGTLTIVGGTFTGNNAAIGSGTGGAIYVRSNSGRVSITGTEFTKNSSATNNSATIDAQKDITLIDCNIHDNVSSVSSTNAVYDIQLGNATLNLGGNTKTGVVYRANTNGRIHILETFTGDITLVPNVYTAGTQVVTFAEGITDKAVIAGKIVVGKGISSQVVNTGKYYIDIDGKLQAHAEVAKVGDTRYATLAEALEAVTTEEPATIYLMNNAEFSGTLAIGTADTKRNITITNLAGEDITLTRAEAASMMNVAAGSSLTIACSEGGTITLDGNSSLKTPHLIKNEGTFVLETGATIQNAVTESKSNDEAYNGGALYNLGNATLKGKFIGCQAFNGGAVFNNAGATIEVIGATFTQNTTVGGNGGAIRNAGTLTVEDSDFISNETTTANNGGAIHSSANTLKVTNTNFTSNKAYASGGAIYLIGACEITGGEFSGNIAGTTGGAVYTNKSLTIAGGTFNENQAVTAGGSVYINNGGNGDFSNVTMYGNSLTNSTSNSGGAIGIHASATLNLSDSNIYNNASYEAKGSIPACDIYNAGAATNLTLSGIRAEDGNAETTEQCLVYQSGKRYYVDAEGNLQEDK